MDVFETIEKRRSVRAYHDVPVEQEKLQKILLAARLAPSASNRQEWKFVVVRDPELRQGLMVAARGQQFVAEAPVVIVACAPEHDHVMSCGHASFVVDLSIAVEHIVLAARALGLGTCWIGAFQQRQVRDVLGIPDSVQVVALMPVGYPHDWPDAKERKDLEDIVTYDGWS